MKKIFIYSLFLSLFISCADEIIEKPNLENTFNVFWKYMDEHYIYFNEKNINWDSLYTVYAPRAKNLRTDDELDSLLNEVLSHWEDGHLSIRRNDSSSITSDSMRYRKNYYLKEPFPVVLKYDFGNYLYKTNEFYLSSRFSGVSYLYLKVNTFMDKDFTPELSDYLRNHNNYEGIIVDFRYCLGGHINIAINLASLFYSGERVLFYTQSKIGKGHSDFGTFEPVKYMGKNVVSSTLPIVALTDSSDFSASNLCPFILSDFPNVTIVGTTTGGGGSPIQTVYLPNGWALTYPDLKCFSISKDNMEYGLKPNVFHNFKRPKYETSKRDDHVAIALEILDSIVYGKSYYDYRNMYQDKDE